MSCPLLCCVLIFQDCRVAETVSCHVTMSMQHNSITNTFCVTVRHTNIFFPLSLYPFSINYQTITHGQIKLVVWSINKLELIIIHNYNMVLSCKLGWKLVYQTQCLSWGYYLFLCFFFHSQPDTTKPCLFTFKVFKRVYQKEGRDHKQKTDHMIQKRNSMRIPKRSNRALY